MFNVRNMGAKEVMKRFIQMLILQDASGGRTLEPKVKEVLFPASKQSPGSPTFTPPGNKKKCQDSENL